MASEIDKQIAVTDGEMTQEQASKPDYQPIYTVYEGTRVPVSKSMGKLWKMRFNEAKQRRKQSGEEDRWDEVIGYYQSDHGAMYNKKGRLNEVGRGTMHEQKYSTENIVFANTSALVPATYAKNPDLNVTSFVTDDDSTEKKARLFERLVDTLFKRKAAPGLNLKPKMKKVVLTTTLTNIGYMELSYVRKEQGSEQAVQEVTQLSKQLSEATDVSEIQEIEGKLQALEERVGFLSASGPKLKLRHPKMVIIDPSAENGDPDDADWLMIGEFVRTDYLRAVYGKKDKDSDEWKSIYKPTHVLSGEKDIDGHDDEINHFSIISGTPSEHEKFGYHQQEDFDYNCRTLCWYVWDKTTRRVYMFNNDDWSWPIWVWDDPYKLSRFFPLFALSYTTDPELMFAKSEVMYYLDHQDELNEINNERARMRHWVMSKVFVDKNAVKDVSTITRFLHEDTKELVHGIDLPEGKKLSDIIGAFPAPSTQFEQLFDPKPILESINRLSSVTPVLQNVQYKTNTTNKAIESYESSTQQRLDEKIDAIEDILADLGRALLEMCVQYMTSQEVEQLLGPKFVADSGGWSEGMTVEQFNQDFNLDMVGGSTLKPTSKVKKEQATQLSQVLGQFANASPMVVIVMLKMIERAFADDVVITPQEWDAITQSTQAQMAKGGPAQGQQQGAPQQQGGDPNQQGQEDPAMAIVGQVANLVDHLPPQAKQQVAEAIAKGVPFKSIIMQLTQMMHGANHGPQQQGGPQQQQAPQQQPPQPTPQPAPTQTRQ